MKKTNAIRHGIQQQFLISQAIYILARDSRVPQKKNQSREIENAQSFSRDSRT